MKKSEAETADELRSEYDLTKLRVRRIGLARRRGEIFENYQAGLKELRDGKLTVFSDVDELIEDLSHD
jgi:hypothetical protein